MRHSSFPNVRLEHTGVPKKIVAANGERISDVGEKTTPCKTSEGGCLSINSGSANVVELLTWQHHMCGRS